MKNVIAVGAGKGGVGKTTVAVALGLRAGRADLVAPDAGRFSTMGPFAPRADR